LKKKKEDTVLTVYLLYFIVYTIGYSNFDDAPLHHGARTTVMEQIDLHLLNRQKQREFTRALGEIFEHSPWVAERGRRA